MLVSVLVRRLKPGKTYDDFRTAWQSDDRYGAPVRVINARSLDHPDEIVSIGLMDIDTDALPELGMADGYAIQQHLVSLLLADGERVCGYKLGLTSTPMQKLLGVDSPDFGPVFASTVYRDGAELPVGRFIAPRMEGEIGVVLDRDLRGPDCTPAEALQALYECDVEQFALLMMNMGREVSRRLRSAGTLE